MPAPAHPSSKEKNSLNFLLKKGGIAFLLRGLTMAGQYLLVFTLARKYGAAEMGSFTIAITTLQLFAILAQAGLDNRLTKYIAASGQPPNPGKLTTGYLQSLSITLITSLVAAVLFFLISPLLAIDLFHKPQLEIPLKVISIALIPFALIGINGAAFRGLKNMTGFLLFKGLIPFLTVIILLFPSSDAFSPVLAYLIATFVLCAGSFISWYKYIQLRKGDYSNPEKHIAILRDGLPMMLTGSVFFLMNWTDNLMLGIFRSEAEVGIYDAAFKIASATAIILMGLNAIQGPVFSELYHANKLDALNKQVRQSTRILFFITLPFTILVCIFHSFILKFFGSEFMLAGPALIILVIGNFISSISGSVGILLQMTGHHKEYNRIVTITAIGSVILNLILIPEFGIVGAAIASCLAKSCQNIASVIYTYRTTGLFTLYLPGIDKLFPLKQSAQG